MKGQIAAATPEEYLEKLEEPRKSEIKQTRALIFDATYDDYRGVIVYFRLFDGELKIGDKIRMMGIDRTYTVTELGKYTPRQVNAQRLGAGPRPGAKSWNTPPHGSLNGGARELIRHAALHGGDGRVNQGQ